MRVLVTKSADMTGQYEEFQFTDSYNGQCFDNDYLLSGHGQKDCSEMCTQMNGRHLNMDSRGPFRVPKRRGRPIANNAARERSRVKTLRSAFLELQRTLPAVPPDTKLSKLDVLVLATTYIAHLMSALQDDGDVSQIFAANGCMHPVKVNIKFIFSILGTMHVPL